MAWITFGTAVSPEPMSQLDVQFGNVASGMSIPCTAAGANTIALTPLSNFPSLGSYNELGGYRFVAAATSTGAVTLQYNGLGFLPVYHADGVTQASVGDFIIGQQYIATFHQALNGGLGGFFFESASTPVVTAPWFTPGGRLTFQSATPVMFSNQLTQQTIFYAPYLHPFVPIYNGSNVQMYQFTSSLSDQVGLSLALAGSANWPTASVFDVFVTLNAGVPTLGTVQWTNQTTRALTLSVFGGFLTNSGATTLRIGAASTIPLPINQGTFLGSFFTSANGQSQWVFGGAASGGSAGAFYLSNYYNPVQFTSICEDTGAGYAYASATVRQARASTGNQFVLMQTSSERSVGLSYNAGVTASAAGGFTTGIGFNSTTAFQIYNLFVATVANNQYQLDCSIPLSFTGAATITALEQANSAVSGTFDAQSVNQLKMQFWA